MNKDKELEELFLAQQPHFDDNEAFMASLNTPRGHDSPLQMGYGGSFCRGHHQWCRHHRFRAFHARRDSAFHI